MLKIFDMLAITHCIEVKMNIIKKMIEKNKLKRELHKIEDTLKQSGYYDEMAKLDTLIYQPDSYASLLFKIKRKYCPLLTRKEYIQKKINQLSGKQQTTQNYNEFTK